MLAEFDAKCIRFNQHAWASIINLDQYMVTSCNLIWSNRRDRQKNLACCGVAVKTAIKFESQNW